MSERDRPEQAWQEQDDPPLYDEGGELPPGLTTVRGPLSVVSGAHVDPWSWVVGKVREGDVVILATSHDGDLVITSNLPTTRATALLTRAAGVLRGDVQP